MDATVFNISAKHISRRTTPIDCIVFHARTQTPQPKHTHNAGSEDDKCTSRCRGLCPGRFSDSDQKGSKSLNILVFRSFFGCKNQDGSVPDSF